MTSDATRRQLGADAQLLLVTLLWGSTFVMVKDAVASYPVFSFLAIRFSLATLALLLIGGHRLPRLGWRGSGAGVLIGAFLFASYGLQTTGLQHTSASKAGFITGLSVIMVPVLSVGLLRRKPERPAMIGVLLATLGLGVLTLTRDLNVATGDLIVLGCALAFALHIISVSVFAPRWDPLALTIVQLATVACVSAMVAVSTERPLPAPTSAPWFAAAFTGVLATALAFAIQTTVQRLTTPTHTALIFAAEPVFAALFGVLLAGDAFTSQLAAGGILIVVGTITSEIPWSRRTAVFISRFLSPPYLAVPLLIVMGLCDPDSRVRGVLWALGVALVALVAPLLVMRRELSKGKISDWHITAREERLKPVPILMTAMAVLMPLALLLLFHGPRFLLAAFLSATVLVALNLLITVRWKISQHVSGIAVSATLVAAALGPAATPVLLLIPVVAWARVKVGVHTVWQTVAGAAAGVAIPLAMLRFMRLG